VISRAAPERERNSCPSGSLRCPESVTVASTCPVETLSVEAQNRPRLQKPRLDQVAYAYASPPKQMLAPYHSHGPHQDDMSYSGIARHHFQSLGHRVLRHNPRSKLNALSLNLPEP
jgi:hypothetical protein